MRRGGFFLALAVGFAATVGYGATGRAGLALLALMAAVVAFVTGARSEVSA